MLVFLLLLTYSSFVIADFALKPIGLLRQNDTSSLEGTSHRQLAEVATKDPDCTGYFMSVPIDHFNNETRYEPHSAGSFQMRYFVNTEYYKPGGPIIVLQAGESDASKRCPILYTGIINILAKATNGIGLILEHRYYGESVPVPDYTVQNLRFLTTEQAMADMAYFAQRFRLPHVGDLSPTKVPWIIYGGSYAGALAAFSRKIYPDIFWGAIGSSAVTQATWDYGYYWVPIAHNAPKKCISITERNVRIVDNLLKLNQTRTTSLVKTWFGLEALTYDTDFVNALTYGIGSWQYLNWDPDVSQPDFDEYCGNISSTTLLSSWETNPPVDFNDTIKLAGYDPESDAVAMLNYMNYIRKAVVALAGSTPIGSFYNNHNPLFYVQTSLSAGAWRPWPWQYCTEWGFLQTGNIPDDAPQVVSRLLTAEYLSLKCRYAFNLTDPADTGRVNKYGGTKISYPRLAFVDGSADPWIGATPHGPDGENRRNSRSEPFILIRGAVHHWDENGLPDQANLSSAAAQSANVFGDGASSQGLPPSAVLGAQVTLVQAVESWVQEFHNQDTNVSTTTFQISHDDVERNSTFGSNQPGQSESRVLGSSPPTSVDAEAASSSSPASQFGILEAGSLPSSVAGRYVGSFPVGDETTNRKRATPAAWLRDRRFRRRRRLGKEEGSSRWWPW